MELWTKENETIGTEQICPTFVSKYVENKNKGEIYGKE